MTRRYDPSTDDRTVRYLFQCQMSDQQIAERIGVKAPTISSARLRIGLGKPKGRPPKVPREEEPLARPIDMCSPMAVAFLTFGDRLKEVGGAYRLDGVPVKFFDLMKETNRARANRGLDQTGHISWQI